MKKLRLPQGKWRSCCHGRWRRGSPERRLVQELRVLAQHAFTRSSKEWMRNLRPKDKPEGQRRGRKRETKLGAGSRTGCKRGTKLGSIADVPWDCTPSGATVLSSPPRALGLLQACKTLWMAANFQGESTPMFIARKLRHKEINTLRAIEPARRT